MPSLTVAPTTSRSVVLWLTWAGAFTWLLVVVSVMFGADLALRDHQDDYPYFFAGVGIVLGSVAVGIVVTAVLKYLIWRVAESGR